MERCDARCHSGIKEAFFSPYLGDCLLLNLSAFLPVALFVVPRQTPFVALLRALQR